MTRFKYKQIYLLPTILLVLALFRSWAHAPLAAAQEDGLSKPVRSFDPDNFVVDKPAGLAFSPGANLFFVTEAGAGTRIFVVSPYEEVLGTVGAAVSIDNPLNITFDSYAGRLLLFDGQLQQIIEIRAGTGDYLDPADLVIKRYQAAQYALEGPAGMAINPANGVLYLLDGTAGQLVRVEPDARGSFDGATALGSGRISRIDLAQSGIVAPTGLAFHSSTASLYLMSATEARLYAIAETGHLVATTDMGASGLTDPRSLVFAPSGDPTDDSTTINLYVTGGRQASAADAATAGHNAAPHKIYFPLVLNSSGHSQPSSSFGPGQLLEFSLASPLVALGHVPLDTATLVTTTQLSQLSPPSPDPSGLAYLPASNSLLISDGEVNEIPALFTGDNLFETTLEGTLLGTRTTLPFSDEPTGVAFNPANNHYYFSDDTSFLSRIARL